MNAATVHPTEQALQAYGLGKLDDRAAEVISAHLELCPDCQKRAGELSADSFLKQIRNVQRQAHSATDHMSSTDDRSRHGAASGGLTGSGPAGSLSPELADHPGYEIIRELGRGGMGVVYLAQNTLMGRMEVLKVVSGQLIYRQSALNRFLAEIRNAARLHHLNIVTAYSALRIGESLVLAMEYVEGLDLTKMVQARGALPIAHCCSYAHQAALGLQHAHEHGMVHRDIKPSNLMLSRQSNRALIKVLDFGLAKLQSERAVDGGLTHEGQMLGTPDFIAPEQISNARTADIRADIYSLGCTLYYLLTGKPPFRGLSVYDILQAHHSMEAMPLNLKRPEVPIELAALVAKMMAKEPERRFQEPKHVAHALAPFFKQRDMASQSSAADVSRLEFAPSRDPVSDQASSPAANIVSTPTAPVAKNTASISSPAPQSVPSPSTSATSWDHLIDLGDSQRGSISVGADRTSWQQEVSWPTVAMLVLLTAGLAAGAVVWRANTADGVIELFNLPKDASVYIDGTKVNPTRPGGDKPAVISVAPGKHKLYISKVGMKSLVDELTIQPEVTTEFTVQLVPIVLATVVEAEADEQMADPDHKPEMSLESPAELTFEEVAKLAVQGLGSKVPPSVIHINQDSAPLLIETTKLGRKTLNPTRVVHLNEFNNGATGLPNDINIPHEPRHGVSDGRFYDYSARGWNGFTRHPVLSDSAITIDVRVLSDHPSKNAAWLVFVHSKKVPRGFIVKINLKGELYLGKSPWRKDGDFPQIDPVMGPIIHPAIRPGNEFNRLTLVMKNRDLFILVNGVQICESVTFEYNIIPCDLAFGASGPGMKRAEFDRLEIREILPPKAAPQ